MRLRGGSSDHGCGQIGTGREQRLFGLFDALDHRLVDTIKGELKLPAIEVKYQAVTSVNRIPLVQNGTVDIECGSTTNLVERLKLVAFSPAIFRYNVRTLVKADSGIKSIADLQGKTVVTTAGTTSFRLLREADKGRSLEVSQLAGKDDADFKALVDGVVGGMMKSGEMDKLYSKWFMAPIPPKGITINYPLNNETREASTNPTAKGI